MSVQSHFDFGPLRDETPAIALPARVRLLSRRAINRIRALALFFGGGGTGMSAEPAATCEGIGHKVERPVLVWP